MKIELEVKIKNRLKALMADSGFRNMQSLSDETGISRNTLYMFERGEHSLGLENLCRLLWAFDCTFDDLIQCEIKSNEPTDWDSLSDDLKASIEQGEEEYRLHKQSMKKRRA